MKCIHCNSELPKDAEFCSKCSEPGEVKTIEKVEIKGIGGWLSFFIFGLFISIIINVISGLSDISSIIETPGLTKTWLYGLVFLDILYFIGTITFTIYTINAFSKLKENAVSLGKMYLILIFSTNLISFIFSSLIGEPIATENSYIDSSQLIIKSLVYSVIWFLYLILSKRVSTTFPKENRRTKTFDKIFFFAIITIPIVTNSMVFIGNSNSEKGDSKSLYKNTEYSTGDIIKETVKELKIQLSLPKQLDEITKLVDVTAEPKAIRYHYTLTNVDTELLNNNSLKEMLNENICKSDDSKKLFNQDINIEYSYIVENRTQKYFVTFNKTDCLK